ncbi:TonB-dependent receptor [Uliginosibacterium gangwonense]|uniref:TonB-dependent receptor n=1 Tax=Uliginosibacterium gangwonense TaxID=392736 RepID=UPI00037BE124|nr:TonB-dependent receptor [Uliginosibacterium gangwonense]
MKNRTRGTHPHAGAFRLRVIASQILLLALAPAYAQTTTDLGTVTITGEGDKLGTGRIIQEDATKARSNVTRAELAKERATGNPFQSLNMLPGVNSFNHDATGLFGGGMTMRGFNSDQLGFTVNGAPVNDSGSFAVYPQEYVDNENVCQEFVTQGSTDVDAPHVGATGGNVGISSCDPEDKARIRLSYTIGELSLNKTYLRVDTGRFYNDKLKFFVSASHAEANKWKGEGGADKNHLDTGMRWDLSKGSHISGSVLYNRAVNNNIGTISLKTLDQSGYWTDYSSAFTPGHLTPVNGTAQNETGPNPIYYNLARNPFENAVVSFDGVFKLADNAQLRVQPYYWYGYGTGGTQQAKLSESSFLTAAGTKTGKVDLNGDGDTLDTIVVASSSVTKTYRPGVNSSLTLNLANHTVQTGLWYERAEHRQTGPAVAVDNNGNPVDIWLKNDHITRPDGSDYESRDWKTISPAWQAFLQDSVSLIDDRLNLTAGVRLPHIERDFTNYANEGTGTLAATNYSITKSYSAVLPQVGARYNFTPEHQIFFNTAKNFKAPPNYAFTPSNNNVGLVNGQAELIGNVKPETSINTDLGYRFQGEWLTLSGSLFWVEFKNRQANAYDPVVQKNIYTNAGAVRNRGLELELGTRPVDGWSFYSSLTYNNSKIKNDLLAGSSASSNGNLPTTGKKFVLTPTWMAGLSAQYAWSQYYLRLQGKYTGTQYATLMNDEKVPCYWLFDFDAGYQFDDVGFLKKPTLRLNVSNLWNKRYRNPQSSQSNAYAVNGVTSTSTVYYYLGAPRMTTLSLSVDF